MPRNSLSLMQDNQAKKDFVCGVKFPEYTRRTTASYTYRPATCSKKPKPRKMQVREEIQKFIDELVARGVEQAKNIDVTIAGFANDTIRHLPDIKPLALDSITSAMAYKCAMDVAPEFVKNPLPVKQTATRMVEAWMIHRGLNIHKSRDMLLLEMLSFAKKLV